MYCTVQTPEQIALKFTVPWGQEGIAPDRERSHQTYVEYLSRDVEEGLWRAAVLPAVRAQRVLHAATARALRLPIGTPTAAEEFALFSEMRAHRAFLQSFRCAPNTRAKHSRGILEISDLSYMWWQC